MNLQRDSDASSSNGLPSDDTEAQPFYHLAWLALKVADHRGNARAQRVYRWTPAGGVAHLVYDPSGELLAELGPTATSYVWLGGELLGLVRGGQ